MAYINLMILLSRYIFVGFGVLFIVVALAAVKKRMIIDTPMMRERNRFLFTCLTFFHLVGVSIIAGKQIEKTLQSQMFINGIVLYALFCITIWLLKLWTCREEVFLWLLTFFLLDIGFLMLERLNHKLATKQVIFAVIGTSAALLLPPIFRKLIQQKYKNLYLGIVIVTSLLPFVAGSTVLGATNWVSLGPIQFQPSEIGKLGWILYLASSFQGFYEKNRTKQVLLPTFFTMMIIVGCLVLQRDLGAALLYYLTFLIFVLMGTQQIRWPVMGLGIGAIGSIAGYFLFSHVRVRVEAWLNPWEDITGKGYQVVQGLFAMGTWGWLGSGLTRGVPNKIPIVTTDYIFAAICEEFGSAVGIIVLLVYFVLVVQCLKITLYQTNRFYQLILIGIAAIFTLQIFLIIGGVLKLIPLTGITAPLLSYGGTSMVVTLGMIGMMTFLSHQTFKQPSKGREKK